MNRTQALALLELIADLYVIANQPETEQPQPATSNGAAVRDEDPIRKR